MGKGRAKLKDEEGFSPGEEDSLEDVSKMSHRALYKRHAALYPDLFRAKIDYHQQENGRQVVYAVLSVSVMLGISCWFQSQAVDNLAVAARLSFAGVSIMTCTYCFLQTKDTLLVRPHPGFWRIVHGMGILYLLLLVVILMQDKSTGKKVIGMLFPGVNVGADDPFEGSVDLMCAFNVRNLMSQVTKPWFTCHILGFVLKMCIFRDWTFCFLNSFFFEALELSLIWLVPELRECWWDSMVLDLLTNFTGMAVGVLLLRHFKSIRFDWGGGQAVGLRRILVRLMPFYWTDWDWGFVIEGNRLFHAGVMMITSLFVEFNSFLLMYALDVPPPPTSWILFFRMFIVICVSLCAAAEHYHYTNTKRRVGHNAWLIFTITLVELIVSIKHGHHRFQRYLPDLLTTFAVGGSILSFSLWCFFRFKVVGTMRGQLNHLSKVRAFERQFGGSGDNALSSPPETPPCGTATTQSAPSTPPHGGDGKELRKRKGKLSASANGVGSERALTVSEMKSPPVLQRHDTLTPAEAMLTEEEEERIAEDTRKRSAKWGMWYSMGLQFNRVPLAVNFLPLCLLVRLYAFGDLPAVYKFDSPTGTA